MSYCGLSIVTVCYNAEQTIGDTILSILNQTYSDFEYIIIDGNSTDQTNVVLRSICLRLEQRELLLNIYQNRIRVFMNADDSYYDERVLSTIFAEQYDGYDVLYGSTNYIMEDGKEIQKPCPLETLQNEMAFGHQSSFVRTSVARLKKYDVSYELSSDYQLFLELRLENRRFFCLEDIVVANFSYMGKIQNEEISIY